LFYAVTYARDVRASVAAHATRLIYACQKIAGDACLATIEAVEVLALECGDLEGPDKSGCKEISKGVQEFNGFEHGLDTADKIGVAREFVPSLTAVVVGLVGLRSGGGLARTSFTGLALAGIIRFLIFRCRIVPVCNE
jgi:hypothetical protein